MPWMMTGLYGWLPSFLLVLFRVSGLMLSVPLFSSAAVPMRVKVCLAVAISLAVFPAVLPFVPTSASMAAVVVGLLGELAIGVFIGMGVTLILTGVQIGIQLVGQQSGMQLGDVYNPMFEASGTVVSQVYYLVAMMVFVAVKGDHAVVRALLDSFRSIPPLEFSVSSGLVELLVDLLAAAFGIAIRVSGPTVLALMMAFLLLGFLSRTIPQLNILSVGFPLKLAVGWLVMALTMVSLESVLLDGFSDCLDSVRAGLGLNPTG